MARSIGTIALVALSVGTASSARADGDTLVGFQVGFWDYVTFASLAVIVLAFLALAIFILGLPGRIAIARNHPEADAVYLMGWVGFLAVVPWISALIWAFKPTDVIDIRHLPKERQRETEAAIARLTSQAPPATESAEAPPAEAPLAEASPEQAPPAKGAAP